MPPYHSPIYEHLVMLRGNYEYKGVLGFECKGFRDISIHVMDKEVIFAPPKKMQKRFYVVK